MLGDLFREGFDITTNHEDADAIVVNTCAFVDEAKAESISAIMDAAAHKAGSTSKRVVVTGCMAQRYAAELAAELPEADLVVGFERYGELAGALHASLGSGGRGGGGGGTARRRRPGPAICDSSSSHGARSSAPREVPARRTAGPSSLAARNGGGGGT